MRNNVRAAIPKGILSKIVVLAVDRVLWKAATGNRGPRWWFLVGLYVGGPGFELGPEVAVWQKITSGREICQNIFWMICLI